MALSTRAANRKDINTGRDSSVTFQHRHFAKIADILNRRVNGNGDMLADEIIELFAQELSHTNPNFDRDRFIAACKVEG